MNHTHKNVLITVFLFTTLVLGCASPHKARDINTVVDMSASVSSDSVVGIKDGNVVYQRKVLMSEELRSLQYEVYGLEAKVYGGHRYYDNRGLYGVLKDCRMNVGDVENGGEGKLQWMEKRDYVTQEDEFSVVGIEDKKRIVGLSEEFLKDRISRFQTYRKVLIDRQDEYETKIKSCSLELKAQRAVAGK